MTRTVFTGADVFDGTGSAPYRADVAVEDGRFAEVGTGLTGDETVDVTGRTLLPGLFDCHVHVLGVAPTVAERLGEPFSFQFYNAIPNLRRLLECGITTVRDCAGADLGVKQALRDGLIAGPRLQISITAISQTGGHMDGATPSGQWVDPYYLPHPGRPGSIADGVTGVRKAVRRSLRMGADFVKVLATHSGRARYESTRFTVAELEAVAEEARAAGVAVAVHAYGPAAIKDAIRAGARSIEHIAYLDDEAIALMKESGTWLVPTVAMEMYELPESEVTTPEAAREAIGHQDDPGQDHVAAARKALAELGRAHRAGIRIAMGTDFGNTAGDNLDELRAMTLAGLSPAEALVAATSSAAELLGLDDQLGTVTAGKRADLVVVDGDPYDFAALKGAIESVYMDGGLVYRRSARPVQG
ncbi:amidohydrolase family protein [Streptosporangium sp. NPDC051022]|uniref:metal-dependent hydrolase family protein n=1 Tax=Streptosporangium sp. NPDC051022 TaxID=3155752 RepID=UPI0034150B37